MILQDFYNIHKNQPIFIIGSGASVDYYPCDNFKDLITIGVNMAYKHFDLKYNILHHHSLIPDCINFIDKGSKTRFFVSEYDCGVIDSKFVNKHKSELYITYKHNNQTYQRIEHNIFDYIENDSLYVGGTTTVNAISLAVYMGSNNIILVGCDAGSINGDTNFKNYYNQTPENKAYQQYHSVVTVDLIKKIRDILKTKNISLTMLSPFLDYKLEGNKYCKNYEIPNNNSKLESK